MSCTIQRITILLALILISPLFSINHVNLTWQDSSKKNAVIGKWTNAEKDARFEIYNCGR